MYKFAAIKGDSRTIRKQKLLIKDPDAIERVRTEAQRHKRQLVGKLEGTTKIRKEELKKKPQIPIGQGSPQRVQSSDSERERDDNREVALPDFCRRRIGIQGPMSS